jgi:glycosyltransferase involved in cell wall biosynthesis
MSQNPLLSIVVAVYNGGKFLAQFFECIEQQQLESYELILVNDGSTDDSLAVIDAWRDRMQNVTLIQQENQGVSVARNSGLAIAKGKYLTFPDIDDKLYPGMFRTLLDMAEKAILMLPPVMAAMFTKRTVKATLFSHLSAYLPHRYCRATSG